MQHISRLIAAVALFAVSGVANGAAQEDDTVFGLLSSIVDDTTCGDAIGRTYRSDTLISAARNEDAAGFFARHESCAGTSGRAAEAGVTPIPLGLIAQCSEAVVLPGWQYEWVICDLTFIPKEGLTTPVHIELSEFDLMSNDDQKIASYTSPDLYVGQMNDMSGGIDVAGPDPAPGVVAFPIYPGQVEAPFLLAWRTSGDFIIADELEPKSSEFFIRDMQ